MNYKFKTKPYAHQLTALEKSWNKENYAYFMEMGTGKTKVLIDNVAMLYDKGKIDGVLIVAPKGVVKTWYEQELPTHLPDHIENVSILWQPNITKTQQEKLESLFEIESALHILVMNVEALSTDKGVKFANKFINSHKALMAIDEECADRGVKVPIMVSGTITDASGRTLSGQTTEAFLISISHMPLLSVGLNCALGASQLRPYLQTLSEKANFLVSAHPNAGLPNEFGEYDQTPSEMGDQVEEYLQSSYVNILGGCCGTTPEHIKEIDLCFQTELAFNRTTEGGQTTVQNACRFVIMVQRNGVDYNVLDRDSGCAFEIDPAFAPIGFNDNGTPRGGIAALVAIPKAKFGYDTWQNEKNTSGVSAGSGGTDQSPGRNSWAREEGLLNKRTKKFMINNDSH